jgi:hypothetical protein
MVWRGVAPWPPHADDRACLDDGAATEGRPDKHVHRSLSFNYTSGTLTNIRVLGRISIEMLEALAKLKFVRYVSPQVLK